MCLTLVGRFNFSSAFYLYLHRSYSYVAQYIREHVKKIAFLTEGSAKAINPFPLKDVHFVFPSQSDHFLQNHPFQAFTTYIMHIHTRIYVNI